ncbi:MAG: isopropylmalate/homocitrate/citramalate synthase, partial [Proteobacteria bacterium]|nr:isopropylmalate/homocitrate/citramalate synthase [Pseudomonadota bacterium]
MLVAVTETDVVTAYYEAFNRGAWDVMCGFLAEEVAHDLNQG